VNEILRDEKKKAEDHDDFEIDFFLAVKVQIR
jgi:hypothetical protein